MPSFLKIDPRQFLTVASLTKMVVGDFVVAKSLADERDDLPLPAVRAIRAGRACGGCAAPADARKAAEHARNPGAVEPDFTGIAHARSP